jgi:hypothetical protein
LILWYPQIKEKEKEKRKRKRKRREEKEKGDTNKCTNHKVYQKFKAQNFGIHKSNSMYEGYFRKKETGRKIQRTEYTTRREEGERRKRKRRSKKGNKLQCTWNSKHSWYFGIHKSNSMYPPVEGYFKFKSFFTFWCIFMFHQKNKK